MKFRLDENLLELVRDAFGELGFDTHTVAQEQLSGPKMQQSCKRALPRGGC